MKGMRNGTQTIKRLRGGCWCLCLLRLWSDIFTYLLLEQYGKLCQQPSMMEQMNYMSALWIKKAYSAKQNGRSLSSYYEELIEFLCELDHYDKVIKENEKDASSYHKSIQWQRVHIFLAGLDGEFEQFCREILRKYPIQDLEECYSMVRRESIRHVTVNRDLEKSEAAAMVRKYRSNQYRPDRMRSKGIKSTYKWTHCDQSGYTKDLCFEIMRYPEWWDHNRDLRKRNASKSFVAAIVEINAKEYVDQQ